MAGSIVIVDDDPIFRALARRMLTACGSTVVGESAAVAGGLSTAMRITPSAALVDVRLPDGHGSTLAHQLTALPWRPHVVLTSVESDVGSLDDVRRSGTRAFVHKADLPNAPLARLLGAK